MSEKETSKGTFSKLGKKMCSSPKGIAVSLLIASVVITGIVYLITSQRILHLGWNILHHPTMLLLNILPVLLVTLLVYFISGRLLFSVSLSGEFFILFALVARVKAAMRQEPLLPADLSLAKEAMTIVKTFPLPAIVLAVAVVAVFLVILVVTFIRSKGNRPAWKFRIIGICAVLVCGFGSNQLLYANSGLYDGYPVIDNPYFQINQYNSKGLVYSFLHQFNIMQMEPPEGYNVETYEAIEKAPEVAAKEKRPHIVMIMGEAFADLSENPHINFDGYRDPMKNLKAMMAEKDHAVSGHISVTNFGGGTANTEYDVLSSCATRYLDNPLPSYSFVRHDFDALPHRLKEIGYDTLSIHPGYEWFYNRQNVYPYLGFEECYFLEDSFNLEEQGKGGYVNEVATMDKIIGTLDEHIKEKDSPLFSFTVTIQNHGPYDKKYGPMEPNFNTDVTLSDSETDLLTQYFQGIGDGDEQLGRLKEYAENSEEPIVLVFFGDHLPGFSNGMDFFDLLDYPIDANGSLEERLAVYETPFIIWQNDSAKAISDITENAKEAALPENGIISSHFLGALLTELLDMQGLSPLYDYANALRKEMPVCANSIYMDAQGNYTDTLPEEYKEQINTLKGWQYYKLFDEKVK